MKNKNRMRPEICMGIKATLTIVAGLALAVVLCGCATGGGKAGGPPGTNVPPLRVGVTPNMPPIVYKQGPDIVGLEADLARALGRELGRPVLFVELRWEEQIAALREGRTDIIMSGMSLTRMRALRIAFTEPYLQVGQMALVRRSDLDKFFTRGSILNCSDRVGVEKGTTGDLLVQQEFTRAQRKVFSSSGEAARSLIAERIDLLIHDAPVVWWLAAENESEGLAVVNIPLTSEYLAWGLREEDEALRSDINRILEQWKEDRKLPGMVKRWVPYAREI